MTVLDASAILALVHSEVGADVVAAEIDSGVLGTANLAEVIGKLVDAEIDAIANPKPAPGGGRRPGARLRGRR